MKIELIDGSFSREDAVELISEMILTKIKFHERKISQSDALEDIQFRERKIKNLSETLKTFRDGIRDFNRINMNGQILIE